MAGYIGFWYFDLGIWNLKRPFLRFMTCETPEGNSITWSNIKKRNRKQSYLTVTYIIVRTLCVWFPNSNLYSGMFHRAWGIPSLYCHPSIQGDRKYYLQWQFIFPLSISGTCFDFLACPFKALGMWCCFVYVQSHSYPTHCDWSI